MAVEVLGAHRIISPRLHRRKRKMAAGVLHAASLARICSFTPTTDKWNICRLISSHRHSMVSQNSSSATAIGSSTTSSSGTYGESKRVWMWTESKQVMTAAVERGWNTFVFPFPSQSRELANEWSSIALIDTLFVEEGAIFDGENRRVATMLEVANPKELELLQPDKALGENVVVDLLDWQVIPAENIVAAFQGSGKTVFAVSKTALEAQVFFEALEHGLGGVVLKVEEVKAVLDLKDYFDRRDEVSNILNLTKAVVTRVQIAGMGDRVCVDLCSLMRPGEGLLVCCHSTFYYLAALFTQMSWLSMMSLLLSLLRVGSFARGLFLVHSECLESNYIASRPFRVNAGPVHAYVAVPGGKTSYLSELKAGKEVILVDQKGHQRTAIVGRVKIETRPLILVEAKRDSDDQTFYSILVQNAETVALVCPSKESELQKTAIPVTSLKVGDEILVRLQGGARHTGIEIQEFIVEK